MPPPTSKAPLSPSDRHAVSSVAEADEVLAEWISSTVRSALVTFGPPSPEPSKLTVNVFLADLEPTRVGRTLRGEPPLRAMATYLVSAWSADEREANRVTSELLFAAMQQSALLTVSSGSALWNAHRLPAHSCFSVVVPVELRVGQEASAKPVDSVQLKTGPARVLNGALRGPGKAPIADALVEIPALNLHTRTDARGLFTLGAVTTGLGVLLIRLTAKGTRHEVRAKLPRFPSPLIIDLENLNP